MLLQYIQFKFSTLFKTNNPNRKLPPYLLPWFYKVVHFSQMYSLVSSNGKAWSTHCSHRPQSRSESIRLSRLSSGSAARGSPSPYSMGRRPPHLGEQALTASHSHRNPNIWNWKVAFQSGKKHFHMQIENKGTQDKKEFDLNVKC